jgi:guanylate kinase
MALYYQIKMTSNNPGSQTNRLLIVLSGPSGAGKDALLNRLRETGYPVKFITTVTTRPRRAQETDGVDYHFVSPERFQEMVKGNELLEWANVYGNWYGVPRRPVKESLAMGRDVILKVDIQGAATIKKTVPGALFVFLTPPSLEELTVRLHERKTECPEDLARRLDNAEREIAQLPLFDYIIVNHRGEIDRVVADLKAIIAAEKCRVKAREIAL